MRRLFKERFDEILSLGMSAAICLYMFVINVILGRNQGGLAIKAALLPVIFLFLFFISKRFLKKETHRISLYRCRYWITALIVLIYVGFGLNGTSLHQWSAYLDGAENMAPLWGVPRAIRSDEWAVWSSFALAQSSEGYPAVSSLLAGGDVETAWISVGGIPAWSLAAFFKPLYWGFLLFGVETGYSLLWILRLVLLFWVSFELALKYTRENRVLSMAAAVTLTFAPYVQWFFSQSIAEVLIYAQGILLAGYAYINAEKQSVRIASALLAGYMLGCYVMIAYPSWLISMLYLLIPLSVWGAWRNRSKIKKKTVLSFLTVMAIPLACVACIAYLSWDTLEAVSSSVYPGKRVMTGGDIPGSFLTGLFSLIFPLKAVAPGSNVCELSNFLAFAPAGVILAVYSMWEARKRDNFSLVLIGVEAFFMYFVCFGVSETVAKLTLLSQCRRIEPVIGLIDTMLLYRSLSNRKMPMPVWMAALLAVVSSGIIWLLGMEKAGYPLVVDLGVLGIGCVMFLMIYHQGINKPESLRRVVYAIMCVTFLAGGMVNPVQRGTSCIDELNLVKALRGIEDQGGLYLVEHSFPYTNAPLLAGKKCYNATSVYPDVEKWESLDPEHEYEEVYNRFCHVNAALTEDETSFELLWEDQIRLNLSFADLEKIGIEYLISPVDYTEWETPGIEFVCVGQADDLFIYRVAYI